MSGGKEREPTGDVLFAEREGLSGKQDEWIKNGAPRDLILIERVVQMARADGIFGEGQRAGVRFPEGEGPVTNEHGEAIATPVFVSRRDDLNIRGGDGHNFAQTSDQS